MLNEVSQADVFFGRELVAHQMLSRGSGHLEMK
jgi:hypothetical protein